MLPSLKEDGLVLLFYALYGTAVVCALGAMIFLAILGIRIHEVDYNSTDLMNVYDNFLIFTAIAVLAFWLSSRIGRKVRERSLL